MTSGRGAFSVHEDASIAEGTGRTHLRSAETGGAMGVFEAVIAPGHGVHWHTHTREDETFRVVGGQFRFWCGEDVVEAGPGSVVFAPRNLRHRWQNVGGSVGQLLFVVTPGGFEAFFDDLAKLADATPVAIFELETAYGVHSEILGS